jgi:hypothetical protein
LTNKLILTRRTLRKVKNAAAHFLHKVESGLGWSLLRRSEGGEGEVYEFYSDYGYQRIILDGF